VVTAKVLGQQRGPKIRIGKYKKRTGYKRHTGFRAALTQIEIESIGGTKRRAAAAPKVAEPKPETSQPEAAAGAEVAGLPAGYEDMTVAAVKEAVGSWDEAALKAALEHEQAHGKRKGAIAALESALTESEKE
jgi:large subunit ribosomal protein L21